jgi:hypothetical protein
MDFKEQCLGVDVDWTNVAQDMDQRRALVNAAMNLRVPKMRGMSQLAE